MILLAALLATPVGAQTEWSGARWRIEAAEHRLERIDGRDALLVRAGTAWLDSADLREGTIAFELRVSDELGFHGVAFRAVDDQNHEHVYLRPFVSGQPDATQYTPVHHGVTGWQIYAGPSFARAVPIPTGRWIDVELRVRGTAAELIVDGESVLFPELQRAVRSGRIGLTSGGAPARFANVTITPGRPALADAPPVSSDTTAPGLIGRWLVSSPFAESRLDPTADFDRALADSLTWRPLDVGVRGIANLALLHGRSNEANTVVARATLHAERDRRARLRFGFSDRVVVYLNGVPLYRGADVWRARDYKFLGTVGLYDEVVLPLRAGENELWLAVSEDFGGWAVTAQVVDESGGRGGGAGGP